MAKAVPKIVLFLDSAPADRGRAAEAEFNAAAATLGLPWRAQCAAAGNPPPPLDGTTVVVSLDPAGTATLVPPNPGPPAVENWTIPTGPAGRAAIGREVSGLVARLLGGRVVADPPPAPPPTRPEPAKPKHTVRVGRETAGRRGKGVTTVFELPLTVDQMKDLAAALKNVCGTGGTVKDARIEIQGDHRDKITAELEKRGYKVKRTGG